MDSILPGGEFNAGFLQGIPAFPVSLSLEGFSQMVCNIGSRMRSPEQRTAQTGRTCSSDMYSDMLKQLSAYSKEPGESGGSAAWRNRQFSLVDVARLVSGKSASNSAQVVLEVYQELKDNILQFKFPGAG